MMGPRNHEHSWNIDSPTMLLSCFVACGAQEEPWIPMSHCVHSTTLRILMLVLCFISEASEKLGVTLPHWRCNDIVTCSSFRRHDRTKQMEAPLEHWQYRYTALYHLWDLRNHTYPRNIWHAIILLPSYGYPVCVCNHIQPWRNPERCPTLNMVRLCCVSYFYSAVDAMNTPAALQTHHMIWLCIVFAKRWRGLPAQHPQCMTSL